MAQHMTDDDQKADKTAMRHLGIIIGSFMVATIVLATAVGMIMTE